MIITRQKSPEEVLKYIPEGEKVFIIGCGECSTTCQTGGEAEILKMKDILEKSGRKVTGSAIPDAPCVAAQLKTAMAKNIKAIKESDSILALACGLGAQSIKENDRTKKTIHIGCDTLFMGATDAKNDFFELCSACGDCVLELTAAICPITRCPKSLMNGPCGGQDKGKCEVDKERDCAWVMIYKELKERDKLELLKELRPPKDYSKLTKPRKRNMSA